LNNDIISYMRDEFKILIGERTAEMVKIANRLRCRRSLYGNGSPRARSFDRIAREVVVTDSDIREAMPAQSKAWWRA